ncbi:hypothetical protein BZA70DRAFT_296884 [Myxozyma melibiosi]|uniref:SNF5-domain-containing protein n=1 Tax=Myxozyma melibiosi TaxID=54550 RepID=A0ABR1F107_9ASCO
MSRRNQYSQNHPSHALNSPYNPYAHPTHQQQVFRKGQASITTYSSRLRQGATALLVPQGALISTGGTLPRAAKRNYAELDDDDDLLAAAGLGTPSRAAGAEDEQPVVKSRPAFMTNHVYHTEEQLEAAANLPEILIPIRINLDLGSYRLADFFLWNLSERLTTPEQFAAIMCTDLDIPVHTYAPQIANAIRTQIEEYAPVATINLPPGIQNVIVRLSLHLAKHLYEDKFEWDLASTGAAPLSSNNNDEEEEDEEEEDEGEEEREESKLLEEAAKNGDSSVNEILRTGLTPEQFARTVVSDLGLTGEFYPAIAHAIYEVLIRLKKEACEGHLPIEVDNDAAYNADAGWRVDQEGLGDEWAPTVEELTQEEIERREVERERNIRRLRRETAKFGDSAAERAIAVADATGLLSGSKKRRRKTTMF